MAKVPYILLCILLRANLLYCNHKLCNTNRMWCICKSFDKYCSLLTLTRHVIIQNKEQQEGQQNITKSNINISYVSIEHTRRHNSFLTCIKYFDVIMADIEVGLLTSLLKRSKCNDNMAFCSTLHKLQHLVFQKS